MGFSCLKAAAIVGLEALPITVEADISSGLPKFSLVGLPDTAISESRERVRSAIKNSNLPYPRTVITVNLAPAHVKKQGPAYDFAIAMSILGACGELPDDQRLQETLFLGELALDGSVRPIRGMLLCALMAKRHGFKALAVAPENAQEALLVAGLAVHPIKNLEEIVHALQKGIDFPVAVKLDPPAPHQLFENNGEDFMHIKGQEHAKRALEIAAAGAHNALLSGSPGSGKTLLARSLPSILPSLSFDEALEITSIHSVTGTLPLGSSLLTERPFRTPHHSASGAALVGGGTHARPGEISLAHRGVLFLDELPEFHRHVLENLRQPLEDGVITVSRALGSFLYPARFMLVAAMNPCPCGYAYDKEKACECTPLQVMKYRQKISGPLLDRIDLTLHVPRVPIKKLTELEMGESSSTIRERIEAARKIQAERYKDAGITTNAELRASQVKKYCALQASGTALLEKACERLHLSARAYMRLLKVSRTIADLAAAPDILDCHIAEALQFRLQQDMRA